MKKNKNSNKQKKKTGLNWYECHLSVDYGTFDTILLIYNNITSNIIDIHKYLMKKHNIK